MNSCSNLLPFCGLHLLSNHTTGCSQPLGLTTGDVLDWQISASSSYPSTWDAGCQVKYARLHQPNGQAWCAGRKTAGEWILVDLGVPAKASITALMTMLIFSDRDATLNNEIHGQFLRGTSHEDRDLMDFLHESNYVF